MRIKTLVLLSALLCGIAFAHVGNHPSVHDTVAGAVERMRKEVPAEQLIALTPERAVAILTDAEKEILGTEHLSFTVNVPVVVSVYRDAAQGEVPFWFATRGFTKGAEAVKIGEDAFEIWTKTFEKGWVGLGVNSVSGAGDHYFVSLAPVNAGETIEVTDIYPGQHTVGVFEKGAQPYVESKAAITELPEALSGQVLIRGDQSRRRDAQLTNIFKVTDYPSTKTPDDVVLTWSEDPKTTQAIQWRTSTETTRGAVRYQKKPASGEADAGAWKTVEATMDPLENTILVNDPVCNRYTANLSGLEPGTTYLYAVGDGTDNGWLEPAEFTSAPGGIVPFKFIYMGDAQNGLDTWGKVVHRAFDTEPDAAFYIMAGDLVNRGNERNEWDSLFYNSKGIYDRRQLVPCIGNHECQGELGPWMYLELFDLPENGPKNIPAERAYTFEYSNALFVVLDSNLPPADQTDWLENVLAGSKATWKFVAYHHPAYSSGANRDNLEVRTLWGALFDKYHVDLALQGHDHAYLRTYPMNNEKRVGSPAEGTIYIVSNSGAKFYEQGQFDYTEVGMTNLSMYQVLDLKIEGNTLTYKAYDIDGKLRDEFVIKK